MNQQQFPALKSTTVVAVRKNGLCAVVADGQATRGDTVAKATVNKIRRLLDGKVIVGFAGATADAFTLLDKFQEQLNIHVGNMFRAAINLTKEWRTTRHLRTLEAVMIAADEEQTLLISGTGDVLRPDHDTIAIGSGGNYAYAAALALKRHAPKLNAEEIARAAMEIAGEICIYTNKNITIETIGKESKKTTSGA